MESREASDRDRANEALDDVARARAELARRAGAPWWYRWGIAAATLVMFLGLGFIVGGPGSYGDETIGTAFIVLGAIVAPMVLLGALNNVTGVSMDRYAQGLGWWWVLLFVLLALSFALQALVEVPSALAVGGLVAFMVVVPMESHIDRLLNRRLTDAQRTS